MSDVSRLLSRLPPGARQRLLRQVAGGKLAALSGATRGETDRRDPQPPQTADVSQWQEMRELRRVLDLAPSNGIDIPYFRRIDGLAGPQVEIDGRHCLNFASYDYLGLNGHPRIREAVIEAVDRYGTTVSGSRMVAGERALHGELETELAAVYGCEAALTFVSGHATGVSVLSSLFGPHDLICHDALAHNCLVMGAEASGARRVAFAHNDWQAVDDLLTEHRGSFRRVVIVIEGLYSMDGDAPDLQRFVDLKLRHNALLMVDEAHALGVLGATGRGIAELAGVPGAAVDIWMGTLSKALCSAGGYIAGSQDLITLLKYITPAFVYSVGLPPPAAAAALTALRLMAAEPERVARLAALSKRFTEAATGLGFDLGYGGGHAILPVITADSAAALKLSQGLLERGVNVVPATYPGVEEGRARLRFFLSAAHTEAQMDRALAELHALAVDLAPRCLGRGARSVGT
ncbi:MAG: aminotransferase class I/II-fold pyridoxal phosphate-dependent enzyme [Rhodospirillaceae bacterium]|nr:aminotransferase class I/II-fold pyridoxal phosphate-dependent enzyme [Rhodospirillaceae bacterium]